MRSDSQLTPAFAAGLVFGLALAVVALLSTEAVRRARSRRRRSDECAPFIDGVHPPEGAVLDVRPTEEGNSFEQPPRLESEIPEFAPMSQRW